MKRTVLMTVIVVPMVVAATLFAFNPFAGDLVISRAAAQQPVAFELVEVASGLSRPLYVTHAGDGSGRLFIVEQGGLIKVWQDGAVLDAPFLDVSELISQEARSADYTERGLLGLAFHPDYATNGQFFINYTERENHGTVVARYTVSPDDPNQADAGSEVQLLYIPQPYGNHNGGHMAFGPDGYLYITMGDGGSGGDPQGNGQNLGTLLGKLLRIDVNVEEGYAIPDDNPFVGNDAARPEIWAWGLRNAWRFSFDRETGDMFIADVGQYSWEEVSFQPADSPGGENYGWNAIEGTHDFSGNPPASDVVMPIFEYGHSNGRCSITGGYVYRGTEVPGLQGVYLYGDWCTGTIWTGWQDASGAWQTQVALESGRQISSFGEDESGELYVVDHNGALLKVAPGQ